MCIKFEGKLFRKGKYWPIYLPALDIATQGKSKKDALVMIKEAVELYVDQKGFEVKVIPMVDNKFIIKSGKKEDDKFLLALMLKNQRAKYGLSTSEVARRLGITKHAYAQYEQARSLPSLSKIEEFIHAMNKDTHVVLDIVEKSQAA